MSSAMPHWFRSAAAALGFAVVLTGASASHAQAISLPKGLTCQTPLPPAGGVTSKPIACTVDCTAGGKIASAVALRPQSTNLLTITIKGTCVEQVDFLPNGITLLAARSGAGLQVPHPSTDPVLGISGRGVTLTGLTISGGVHALKGHQGAVFTGTNLLVEGASKADVELYDAAAVLNTSTIEKSKGDGIVAGFGSHLDLNGGTVQNNAAIGVDVGLGGNGHIFGGALLQSNGNGAYATAGVIEITDGTVTKNKSLGVGAEAGGFVQVTGSATTVTGNASGVLAFYGGSADIDGGATIANNSGNGIGLVAGGTAIVRGGAIIKNNKGNGIDVETGTVTVGHPFGPGTVEGNTGNGIFLRTNSVAVLAHSANKIIDNTGWGIFCTGGSSNPLLLEYAPATVTGNKAGGIFLCKFAP
jgi:hypothetical protein